MIRSNSRPNPLIHGRGAERRQNRRVAEEGASCLAGFGIDHVNGDPCDIDPSLWTLETTGRVYRLLFWLVVLLAEKAGRQESLWFSRAIICGPM